MSETTSIDLRFPVGKFQFQEAGAAAELQSWIKEVIAFPKDMRTALQGLDKEKLSWRYRPDGWMIKQVVHHCVDSHMNSLIRFKLTLTEESPTIKPYHEDRWAELPEGLNDDLRSSLNMLDGIHEQLAQIMSRLTKEELKREYVHPEHGKRFTLIEAVALYAWHGRHHHAHVLQALASNGKWK